MQIRYNDEHTQKVKSTQLVGTYIGSHLGWKNYVYLILYNKLAQLSSGPEKC
jgi:hypothetical protein